LQQILLTFLLIGIAQAQVTENEMIQILTDYDREASQLCNKNVKANWNVQTDVLNTDLVAEQVSERKKL
jgi:tRNA G26 N,N-dimethylase Trm1